MRDILPRTITGADVPAESSDKSSNTLLIVTGLVAAGAMIYVMRSDVSSQKEWNERYGGLGGRRSAAYRRH